MVKIKARSEEGLAFHAHMVMGNPVKGLILLDVVNTQENKEEELKELYKEREEWRTRVFYITLEIAIVFGVLAFGTLGLTKYLERSLETSKALSFSLLGAAFVLGWLWVIYRYKKIKSEVEKVEKKIKALREDGN